mmetsp:Transcript_9962/g.32292  ORF Transcript_9962/g.32292 Transcript_9962/m.32292 type:complete len:392 (-) Transcript_9962:183-1358(-)
MSYTSGIFASSQRRQSSRQSTSSKVTWPMPQSRDHNDSLDRAADAVRDAVRMADSLSLVSPFAAKGSAPPPPPPSFRPAAQQQHDTTASRLLQGFSSTAYSSTPLPTYTTPSALLAQSAPRPSAAWAPREEAKHRRSGTGERGVARALATSALAAAEASSAYRISTIRTSPPKAYTIIGNTAHRRPSSAGGVAALLARGATSALRPPPAPLSRVPAWEGTPQTPRSQLFNFSSHSKGAASAAHSSRERSPSPAKGGKISTLEKDPRVSPGYNASPGGQRSPLRAGTGGGGGAGGGSPAGAAAREIRGGGDSWAREELRSKEREITRLQEEVKRGHARLADALKSAEATTSAFLAKGAEELETVKSERNNVRTTLHLAPYTLSHALYTDAHL